MTKTDKDEQVGTTGHNWDGITELNNPLPRWWLWTFYGTIAWGLVYVILYPAWPLVHGATTGVLSWSTRANAATEIAAAETAQAPLRDALVAADMPTLADNVPLHDFATKAGRSLFQTNCAQCHGAGAAGAAGARGYPNLLDDDWLWGGQIDQIAATIRHGIRNEDDPDARWSQMPAFGEVLTRPEIATLVTHVQSLSSGVDPLTGPGGTLFSENCAVCHGEDGHGNYDLGAPNLTDAIWLYGSDTDALTTTIAQARFGIMPAWGLRLDEAEVRALAAYVHQLGGGEPTPTD